MQYKMPVFTVEKIDSLACGKIVRDARIKSGMSLRQLAVAIGFSAPFVSDLELGRRSWKQDTFDRALATISKVKKAK